MRKFGYLLCLLAVAWLITGAAQAEKTVTITFTGDITLGGEDYLRTAEDSFASVYEREGTSYFLKNFADFFAEDDLTVVNLEGVLTDNDGLLARDKGKGGDGYWFRGRTEYAQVLSSASVEVVSLANNHSFDYGTQGRRDTIAAVEAQGIDWFGTYNRNKDPETEKFYFYTRDGVTICLMSLLWDDYGIDNADGNGAYLRKQITAIKESGQADAVIAILHGGQEYGRHRTKPQIVFTKMAISAGADLVICHHAHVVMGMDVISNRSAFYSLGNFCFGGNRRTYSIDSSRKPNVQDAAPALILRAVLTFNDDGTYLGQQITLYPVQTTGVDRQENETEQVNDYQPKFVTGPLAAHVLHLMQIDMNYDVNQTPKYLSRESINKTLRALVMAREEELDAMDSSEGMEALTLPYLPATSEE